MEELKLVTLLIPKIERVLNACCISSYEKTVLIKNHIDEWRK